MAVETHYAKSGDVHIAYQVTGHGPFDLIWVPGFVSHLDADWESPVKTRVIERLSTFCRLIRFDKRGTGLSDRVAIPTLEQRMDDVRAVMDAVGSKQAALLGISEGGPMSLLFAATYPERTLALAIYGSYARRLWAPDHPYGKTAADWNGFVQRLEREWGGPVAIDIFAPSIINDDLKKHAAASYFRQAASPGAAVAVMQMNGDIDVRHVLPTIRVPTLIVHRKGDRLTSIEQARYLAEHIRGARLVELPGDDHVPWIGDADAIFGEIEEFLTGVRQGASSDRVLATVLFTDIVGATERAAALGDQNWRQLLSQHHAVVRRELSKFRGREIDTTGDGFLAAFDGPARAVRCAHAVMDAVRGQLGVDIRAGLHTGECEMLEDKLAGLAVHIGARVAALAKSKEVLVSSTVKDLVAGSGLQFEDRGNHVLKGVPGQWHLFAAVSPGNVTH
ncbi:MAG: adenylate/guanylate cyclase domain-containing protein [Burkholderiales bacterium]